MQLEGVLPPMLTPVEKREGKLNIDTLATYTETLVENGIHGLFPCGTNGEFPSLSQEMRRTVIETVAETAGDIPVLAGCGDTSLQRARTLINDADIAGADAAVIVTPYYLSTTQGSLCEYYECLADDSSLPIIIYDIPAQTDRRLKPDSVIRLAEHENILGIKDSGGDLSHFYQLLRRTPEDFTVLQGSTAYALPSLAMGADGFISGGANVFPRLLSEFYNSWVEKDYERLISLNNNSILPLVEAISTMPSISATKYLATLSGHEMGPPMIPLPELSGEQKEWLEGRHQYVSTTIQNGV